MPKKPILHLSGNPEADALISKDPLALLIGMVLDQQIPLEWAFTGPLLLHQRLGAPLDARAIAEMPEEDLVAAFVAKPALHRFPASMARRVHELCRIIVSDYDGKPANIWKTATTGAELRGRLKALPGFGEHKAKIFTAFLGKQFAVTPEGWVEASAPFGEPGSHRSIADIDSAATLAEVREYKRAVKAAAKTGAGAKKARPAARTAPATKRPAKAKKASASLASS